jgi:hypothetical protein
MIFCISIVIVDYYRLSKNARNINFAIRIGKVFHSLTSLDLKYFYKIGKLNESL